MLGTLYFFGCCALLIAGYAVYGAFVERVFGADASRKTPVMTRRDGVDFEPMPLWKLYMSQMINIAGLGPVIGTILGALYGPVALLWVVFGSIFAGAVHDYIAGMISIREDGISYPEIIGRNLGSGVRIFMECFTVIFMVMVGATFVLAPAALLASLFPHFLTDLFPSAPTLAWSVLIFAYYFVATIIPFDRIVSRFYPIVGVMLIFMALGLIVALFAKGYTILPNTDFFTNVHPAHTPVWPILFITIACGAISGFHSLISSGTTSKQLNSEKNAKIIGYGAMLVECALAIVSLITIGYIYSKAGADAFKMPPTAVFARDISEMLAVVGFFSPEAQKTAYGLLILSVSAFCLTSLDTGTRLARYMFTEFWLNPGETPETVTGFRRLLCNKYLSTGFTVIVGIAFGMGGWSKVWPLFGASNQLLAGLALLAVAAWLKNAARNHKMFIFPMVFMILVTLTSLALTFKDKILVIASGQGDMFAAYLQAGLAAILFILAIFLVREALPVLTGKKHPSAVAR